MPASPIAFTTPAHATPWQRWVVFSPVGRIIFFGSLCYVLFHLSAGVVGLTGAFDPGASPLAAAAGALTVELLSSLVAYVILVKAIERRPLRELALRDLPIKGGAGLLAGALLMSIVVFVLWLAGSYHVTGINPNVNWLPAVLTTGIAAGVFEEILTRGILFRTLEEGLGTWASLAISALVFGIAHIRNPGATPWSSLAIAIEAGVLLALLYHVTRSLWPCIGLHAAWNVMQGTIYGIPVSGTAAHGWLVSSRSGPDWLSGGAFGAEASVVALITCCTGSAVLLVVALRRGTLVRPAWQRGGTRGA